MRFLTEMNYDWMNMLNWRERPFRAKFVPSKIWKDLDNYKNDSKGLSNYFKKWRTRIEFRKETSKAKVYNMRIACGGEYDPEARQSTIHIYTDKFDTYNFTDTVWNKFKFRLIQVTMHELIHFMQFDRRYDEWSGYVLPYKKVQHEKTNEERKYLSEFDEIQAYAHCVLLDFKCLAPSLPTQKLLNRSKRGRDSKTLRYILKTFNYDTRNNAAIPKLICQISKWERKYDRKLRACKRAK